MGEETRTTDGFTEPTYRLFPDVRLVDTTGGGVFALTERNRHRIHDAVAVALLRVLRTPITATALLSKLAARCDPTHLLYTLERLLSLGLVEECRDASAVQAGGRSRPAATPGADEIINCREIELLSGPTHALSRYVQHRLSLAGFPRWLRQRELRAVTVADYLDPELDARIRAAMDEGVGIVPFKPMGQTVWFGPILSPNGVCWDCLRPRLHANRPVEQMLLRDGVVASEVLQPMVGEQAQADAAVAKVTAFLATEGAAAILGGHLLTWDDAALGARFRAVGRRPQCPRCGDPGTMRERQQQPPSWRARPKVSCDDGGHRIARAEDVLARLERHVDPLTGVIASLGPLSSKHAEHRPVFAATHFICPAPGQCEPDERFEQVSVGKGQSATQARTSALCEAFERQCARYQGDEFRVRGSYRELADHAIDPQSMLLFSRQQYVEGTPSLARARLLATPRSQRVPRPFDPDQPIDWTRAWTVPDGQPRLVPYAFVFAGAPQPEAERMCTWDSNGCAAGSCLEEAALQGLFELVERDATAIWWYNRSIVPGIDLGSFDNPYFDTVCNEYAALGHRVWALDLTHDLGITTVVALSYDAQARRYAMGLGCHLDSDIAVQRALTELHQVFDPARRHDPLVTDDELPDPSFLWPGEHVRTASDMREPTSNDLRADLMTVVGRLKQAGLSTMVVDYSRPDIDLSTVKVIVPGLRHFWPRFAPGRLFDVPVRTGLRVAPLTEDTLNPTPLLM